MRFFLLPAIIFLSAIACQSPQAANDDTTSKGLNVIAYYSGNGDNIDSFEVEKLSHIIFSFCHLKGSRLNVNNARDTATIQKLILLRKRNPGIKILLSLGGWGGCSTCSQVFSTDSSRKVFASSVKQLCAFFGTDGIDLDWEYPAIEGPPGHAFAADDKVHFTELIRSLRDSLGTNREISFAAGGFKKYFDESVDWKAVMPLVDRVNLMSYDLVGGYSRVTGHHTPLYSTSLQESSADHGVRYLDSLGVSPGKIVIGAAFYARTWEKVDSIDNGLYKSGTFKNFIAFNSFEKVISAQNGFIFFRDSLAAAPYAYNKRQRLFATFDDPVSVAAKTRYALDKKLNGIMFWELPLDKYQQGLVHVIDSVIGGLPDSGYRR